MVTVVVNYELAPSLSRDKVRSYYEQSVTKFEGMPGLLRKYYLLSEDGLIGGSVYLWESRDQALAFHNEDWKEFMRGKYGNRPQVTMFDCQIVIDNVSGDTLLT